MVVEIIASVRLSRNKLDEDLASAGAP